MPAERKSISNSYSSTLSSLPSISVVTATMNSGDTVEDTLRSVLEQSYGPCEHIIVDGGSTDETLSLVKKYSNSVVIDAEVAGIYPAFNAGVARAKGDIVCILNSDDYFFDSEVLKKVALAFAYPDVDIVYGDLIIAGKQNGESLSRQWVCSEFESGCFSRGWHPPHPSFFLRRSAYSRYGVYRTDLPVAADFELMLRMFEIEQLTSKQIAEPLVIMRDGGASHSLRGRILGATSIIRAFKLHGLTVNPILYLTKRYLTKIRALLISMGAG